jgi:hypothetical protein
MPAEGSKGGAIRAAKETARLEGASEAAAAQATIKSLIA